MQDFYLYRDFVLMLLLKYSTGELHPPQSVNGNIKGGVVLADNCSVNHAK